MTRFLRLTKSRSVPTLCVVTFTRSILLGSVTFWLVGCYAPSGEYGGNRYGDPSGPYGIQGADVVKSEEVGTGFDPYGGIYNYEEVDFGPPSSQP